MAHPARNPVLLLSATALAGCASVIQPHLGPDAAIAKIYDTAPTLEHAIDVGTSMRERYSAKVEDQIAWERGVGTGLIGSTAIAANLAARSIAKSEILGLGIGSAAAYTAGNWLFSKPQQMVYAAGANAVQCALDAVQPLQEPYQSRNTLKTHILDIVARIDAIKRLLPAQGTRSKTEALALSTIARANALLPQARDALALLNGAPGSLRSSLGAIQAQVTNAYLLNSPNLQGLVESLGKSLPAMGSRIVGVPLPGIPQPDAALPNTSAPALDATDANGLRVGLIPELDKLVNETADIVASINVKPSEDKLKLCNVDLRQAGLTMKLTPAGEIAVQAGSSGTVVVSGGVLPYRADWIGTRPPADQVVLKIESGQGFITADVKAGADARSYQLLVLDAAQGREVATFTVNAGAPAAPVVNGAAPAPVASTPDPKVLRLQQALLDKGIKSVKVGDKDETLVADGRLGKITVEAMRQYYKSTGSDIKDDQIPGGKQLQKEVEQLLGLQ